MQITLNGQAKEFEQKIKLQNLIEQFCQSTSRIIAEVNGEIIKSPRWQETEIKDGDQIELVRFVGGG